MEIAVVAGCGTMIIAAVAVGVKGYCGLSDRMSRLEAMQRLLLRKNGYKDEDMERDIETELDNHDKWLSAQRRQK